MKSISILKHNLMRAAMTLALIMTCAAAWAQTRETVSYIDADGNPQSHEATVLTGSESNIGSYNQTTWYVVNSNITHNGQIGFEGHVNIILADGKTMTVNGGNDNAFLNSYNSSNSLTIYGQSGQSGTLTCSSTTDAICNSYAGSFIVNSGIVNVTGGSGTSKGIYSKNVTINGGTVNANGCFAIYAEVGGNIAINGGKVTANGTWGIYGKCNVTFSWKNDTDRIYASQYFGYTISIAEGKYFKDASGNIYCGNVSASSINNKTLQPATQTEYIQACLGTGNDGTAAHPYTINDANGWNAFCLALEDKDTWNGFSGKIVKLGANISVSRMAGSGAGSDLTTSDRPFCGTFDGQGNTLTFNYGSSGSPADENNLAPFRYVNNATIRHLCVAGTIYTKHVHAGGIIGMAYGTTNITDCRSSVNIISSINGDGTHGGIMSCSWTGSTTNIEGCLFNGSIQSASGYTTNQCGGFVGWKNATINVSNSLLTADLSTIATPDGLQYPSATFVRHGVASDITNCYYSTVFGIPQGKQRHSITADENVTVAFSGTANEYQTSGITAYKDGNTQLPGLKYGDVLYAGNGDEVSLTLGYTLPEGYFFNGYTVSPDGATLTSSGNAYTLTMPNANVTISADFYYCPTPTLALVDNSITAHGATVSWTGSSDSYILEYAEGNSPSIWTTVSSNATSPYTFNNLNPATTYSVRVTGNCGSDGNNHPNDVVSFTTDCLDFIVVDAAHPFTEDFEGEDFPPHCWENIGSGSQWTKGDYYNHTEGGSNSAYSEYYGDIYLVMPDIQLPSNGTAQLTFWSYYNWLDDYDKSSVVLLDGDTEIELWTPGIYELGEYWYETTIDLTAYMGQTISLAFKYEGENAHGWFVDDVEVTATASIFTKDIEGYENDESGWYLIASPLAADIAPTAVTNMTNETFDLYCFDQTGGTNGKEWKNWKNEGGDGYHFNLEAGKGYLYANSGDVTLVFTGMPFEDDGIVPLTYETTNADQNMWGWNLVGNPFAQTANVDGRPFYVMNEGGSEIIASDRNDFHVEPMEGIFVKAEENGETMTFIPNTRSKGHIQKPEPEQIVINLSTLNSKRSTSIIDRAIVRFDESRQLPKFQIRENSTKIYIPQDGKDYAIVSVGNMGEIPLNFKANENGTYTITVNPEGVEMAYLHLVDNMTGADVDLLAANGGDARPCVSTYTFTAKTTDYESRFKLVFAVGSSTGSDTFAFFSNGNIIVNGEGTLQIFDAMGRQLFSKELSTFNSQLSTLNYTPGVYVLRLINGEHVRTQKIVVE